MLILNINNKKFKYLSRQSEIKYSLGLDLENLVREYADDLNNIEFYKWALSILCGCTYEDSDSIDENQLRLLINNHPFLSNELKTRFSQYVVIDKKLYRYRDFSKLMTVRQYHDLDYISINDSPENLVQALYERIAWYKKPIQYLLLKNLGSVIDMNYFQFKLSVFNYYQYKQKILQEYSVSAYNPDIPADQQSDEYELTVLEKFSLYNTVLEMHDNDIKYWYFWLDHDIRELLKYLAYMNLKISINNQKQVL